MPESRFRRLCQAVRHAPGLESADVLWNALRVPYHWLLNAGGQGVRVSIGNACIARIPGELAGGSLDTYEPQAVAALVDWLRRAQRPLLLDVGSAVGILSVAGLAASPDSEVIAFDSDIASLKAVERICRHYAAGRLTLVHGFVSDRHASAMSLREAQRETRERIDRSQVTGDPGTTAYICLDQEPRPDIPTHSLDRLLDVDSLAGRAVLLKCDVEGAELLVLHGARKLLETVRPVLLLSVHPPALPNFGHTAAQVGEFLESLGYRIAILAIDHEEHWWCEPAGTG
jgi:FkbM family methyltransferase